MSVSDDRESEAGGAQPEKSATDEVIAANLRRAYSEVVDEPLPDRLRDLLSKLKTEESK